MANPGNNEGFHVLDDFVCKAVHDPSAPLANPANQGRNEGMSVIEEVVFEASNESKPGDMESDRQRRAIAIGDVARPIRSGWSELFSGAAAFAFSGLVGGVLRVVGAMAALKDSGDPEKTCQLCGRLDATYSLQCCHSSTCERCLSKMFTPQQEDTVGFRCVVCGHVHTDTGSAELDAGA